jgi:hypothetical protein
MQEYPTLAAVDLGSNSFHLQVGRVEGDQLFYLDAIKESVRLAGGLTENKRLDGPSQRRALNCLSRFGERLRGMQPGAVRAVGTSALRVARNSAEFLEKAQAALGFDIEIVAGREEARLIYLGVSHSLPLTRKPQLVVDIGGGSTECIIGVGYEARERESLRMGCVVFSRQFFPAGLVDKAAMKAAEIAARIEIRDGDGGSVPGGRLGYGGGLLRHRQGPGGDLPPERFFRRRHHPGWAQVAAGAPDQGRRRRIAWTSPASRPTASPWWRAAWASCWPCSWNWASTP